jgi:hypothetical protein
MEWCRLIMAGVVTHSNHGPVILIMHHTIWITQIVGFVSVRHPFSTWNRTATPVQPTTFYHYQRLLWRRWHAISSRKS